MGRAERNPSIAYPETRWVSLRSTHPTLARDQTYRNAALRRGIARGCLASDIDFAITWCNELLRVRSRAKNPPAAEKSREDFHGRYPRSRHRSGVPGRPGCHAGRLGGAGRNPRKKADAGLS